MAIEKKVSISKPKGDTLDGYGLMDILKAIYPVGAVYVGSDNGVMPDLIAAIGTWVRVQGRMIVGVSSSDSDFDFNDTGGAKTHTLTEAQIPVLQHSIGGGTGRRVVSPDYNNGTAAGGGAAAWGAGGIANHGSGQSHPIMNPFKAKYMWERTA